MEEDQYFLGGSDIAVNPDGQDSESFLLGQPITALDLVRANRASQKINERPVKSFRLGWCDFQFSQ